MIIAATGHRDVCLNWEDWLPLRAKLESELKRYNPTYVIVGMARGWDTFVGLTCLDLKIPIACYIPYDGERPTSKMYEKVLREATLKKVCSPKYYRGVFLGRNDKMLADCDMVFSYLDPAQNSGGTAYTVRMAKQANKEVINFYGN